MLPSDDRVYGDADFLFQEDLVPARWAKTYYKWFAEHADAVPTLLIWTQRIYEVLSRERWETPDRIITDQLKATMKATWTSVTPQQKCHAATLHRCRHLQKGARTLYWIFIILTFLLKPFWLIFRITADCSRAVSHNHESLPFWIKLWKK